MDAAVSHLSVTASYLAHSTANVSMNLSGCFVSDQTPSRQLKHSFATCSKQKA